MLPEKKGKIHHCNLFYYHGGCLTTIMHQSIPPVPIPHGLPQGICSSSLSRGWGICAPRGDPPGI